MFSTAILRYELHGTELEPSYLDDRYAPLVRALVLHYEAFAGKPFGELDRAVARCPELSGYGSKVAAGLRSVIEEFMALEVTCPVDPGQIRAAVFAAAAASPDLDHKSVFNQAREELGIEERINCAHLYGDLKPDRLVRFTRRLPPVHEIISRYNFRLLQGFFLHALAVRIATDGQARTIYRSAKLNGLLVEAEVPEVGESLVLQVTGPLSLFHKTRKYGRALARFLPACATAGRFRIDAQLSIRGKHASLTVTSADRILSSHRPPRLFDSKIEERFQRDFLALHSHWTITREEQIILLGRTAFIPDFTFRLTSNPELRVDLEIVGFWTRDYLSRKQNLMHRLPGGNIIFCVDSSLCCDCETGKFPCIPFSRRVPAKAVLKALDALIAGTESQRPGEGDRNH